MVCYGKLCQLQKNLFLLNPTPYACLLLCVCILVSQTQSRSEHCWELTLGAHMCRGDYAISMSPKVHVLGTSSLMEVLKDGTF